MKNRIQEFKKNLAAVFDDNLHTKKWHNIVDWLIIGLILVSTAEIFISTFDIDPELRKILLWVDAFILVFFTIEVTLRIWVAPLVNPKYKGWKGRLKYCFSFHGFIDIVSTYPFYLQWLIPFPILWLRAFRTFRVIRLFRISRYMKSWKLLENTFKEKKRELIVSSQFLIVITLILSLILYFCEHEAQPENYDNGFSSVLWAFGQYIGDPGGFSENPPITGFGKAIACVVGLLGIAIVAVPAGILGSGFTEAIEHERDDEKLKANQQKLLNVFDRKLDRPTGFQAVPFFKTIPFIQARVNMSEQDIFDTVGQTPGFRIINTSSTIPLEQQSVDQLAVEHFPVNTSYGCLIDRGSSVTIIASGSLADAATGIFSFYVALFGGFNFISRDLGRKNPFVSMYIINDYDNIIESEREFFQDLKNLLNRENAWSFDILASSGALENAFDTEFHFGIGNAKGDESFGGDNIFVKDITKYKNFYDHFSKIMKDKFGIETDNGKYHSYANPKMWPRIIEMEKDVNSVMLRVAWSVMLWNDKRLLIAQTIAECINKYILGKVDVDVPESLKIKGLGFKGYDIPNYKL